VTTVCVCVSGATTPVFSTMDVAVAWFRSWGWDVWFRDAEAATFRQHDRVARVETVTVVTEAE